MRLLVADLGSPAEAARAARSLNSMLDEVREEVSDLFSRQDGVADAAAITRVYARLGLRNETGWEQERPVIASGKEVLWELPEGAYPEDAEAILWSVGARDISLHEAAEEEPWRDAPHPMMAMEIIDEDADAPEAEEEDGISLARSDKRTLH